MILQGFLLFFFFVLQVSGMYVAFFVVFAVFALFWISFLCVGSRYSEFTRRRLITASTAVLLLTALSAYTIEFRSLGPVSPVFSTINPRPSSAGEASRYVEDGVRITLPVTQEAGETAFNDGGTKMIRITDAEGKTFDVYIAHRFSKQAEWGAVYLNAYPGTANSVRVRDQDRFKQIVLKGLHY
jgi:hypothetical protein